jgi:hypothetical protein
MRFSRLDLLIPAEPIESAAVPTVPAESTASELSPVAQSEHRRR